MNRTQLRKRGSGAPRPTNEADKRRVVDRSHTTEEEDLEFIFATLGENKRRGPTKGRASAGKKSKWGPGKKPPISKKSMAKTSGKRGKPNDDYQYGEEERTSYGAQLKKLKGRAKTRLGGGAYVRDGMHGIKESRRLTESEDHDGEPQRTRIQFIREGRKYRPAGKVVLVKKLPPGLYEAKQDMSGFYFERARSSSDKLLRFKSSVMEGILDEIEHFWGLKEDFDNLGMLHRRGILMYGPPGTGKTCLIKQVAERMESEGNICLIGRHVGIVKESLSAIKEIDPGRKVVVVLEDMDEYIGHQEQSMLQLLDGAESFDDVLYLGSTNYVERFPARLTRPGRFDKLVEVGPPPLEGRLAYLENKLAKIEEAETIEWLAEQTKGLGFGHLRELVIAGYALREDIERVLHRLHRTDMSALPIRESKLEEFVGQGRNLTEVIGTHFAVAGAGGRPGSVGEQGMRDLSRSARRARAYGDPDASARARAAKVRLGGDAAQEAFALAYKEVARVARRHGHNIQTQRSTPSQHLIELETRDGLIIGFVIIPKRGVPTIEIAPIEIEPGTKKHMRAVYKAIKKESPWRVIWDDPDRHGA